MRAPRQFPYKSSKRLTKRSLLPPAARPAALALLGVLVFHTGARAQQPPAPETPNGPAEPAPPEAETAPPAPAAAPAPIPGSPAISLS